MPLPPGPRTFEVICRAVFGVTDPARVARLRAGWIAVIDSSPLYMLTPLARRDLGPLSPGRLFTARMATADALLIEEIARRRREPDLALQARRPPASRASAALAAAASNSAVESASPLAR